MIRLVIVFILCLSFTLNTACVSESNRYDTAIEEVLIQDYSSANISADPCIIVEAMKIINTSDCPTDFQYAYEEHTNAWQHSCNTGISEDSDNYNIDSGEIDETWKEVELIAEEYGARMIDEIYGL